MKTIIAIFALISLVSFCYAQGDKATYAQGLKGLTSPYYKSTSYALTQGGDNKGCDMNKCAKGSKTAKIYKATYTDGSSVKICACEEAAMDVNQVATKFGVVPKLVRQYTNFITIASGNANLGCAAYSTGSSSTYCLGDMSTEVFIHESAHNFDRRRPSNGRLSSQDGWKQAIAKDSCVPDGYAKTNQIEDFAQVLVLYMSVAAKGNSIGCMRNQLSFMESVLPREELLANMLPRYHKH